MKRIFVSAIISSVFFLMLSLGAGFANAADKMMDKGMTVKEGEMMKKEEGTMMKEKEMMKEEGTMKKESGMMEKEGGMMKEKGGM